MYSVLGHGGHEARSVSCDVITILLWTLPRHYRHSGLMPGNEGDTAHNNGVTRPRPGIATHH